MPLDHPRSRGVYTAGDLAIAAETGSSPLARGLHSGNPHTRQCVRIIPARAGFTRYLWTDFDRYEDHPRSRGVYSEPPAHHRSRTGSSPLARGLLHNIREQLAQAGIIPARAGFTATSVFTKAYEAGSSPLARGLDSVKPLRFVGVRNSPARGGFTRARVLAGPPRRDHPRSRGVYWIMRRVVRRGRGSSPLARGLH